LIDYVEKHGTKQISQSVVNKFTIGFSNNSKFENEFYTTMNHYCSIRGSRFRRNVKIIDVFPEEKNNAIVNIKEFDGVLYQRNVPKVVFELNGREHYTRKNSIKSDKIKMELLKTKNISLLFVPNQYVKHYEFIRELINKFNGDGYQKELFVDYDSAN
jgi:hypothetical protein